MAPTSVLQIILRVALFVGAAAALIQVVRKPRVRQRLIEKWWIWLPVAVIAAILNDVIDRKTGSGAHLLGDLVVAIVAVAIVFLAADFATRRRLRQTDPR